MGSVQCPPKVALSVAHRQAHIFLCLADFRNQTALVEVMADPLKSNRLVYCSRKMTRQWLWSFTLSGSTLGHLWSIARIHRCCLTKHCKSKALWVRQHSLAHLVLLTYAALCCIQDLPVSVGARARGSDEDAMCHRRWVFAEPSQQPWALDFCNSYPRHYSKLNKNLAGESLPSCLQNLTFGDNFNQTLEEVNLPSGLQSLTCKRFNQTRAWREWACQAVFRV